MALSLLRGTAGAAATGHNLGTYKTDYWAANGITGFARELRVNMLADGNVKLNIHRNSDGVLLWSKDTTTALSAGANTVVVSSLSISGALAYRLGIIAEANGKAGDISGTYSGAALTKALTYSTFVSENPIDLEDGYTASSRHTAMGIWGYAEPSITSIGGDNILISVDEGSTIALVGTGLVADGTEGPSLELCNNAVYGSATVKVPQRLISVEDTAISFIYGRHGILGGGTVYAFFKNDLGLRNATGLAVTLSGTSVNILHPTRHIVSGNYGINGSMFGSSEGVVELCNNATYGSATVKVSQTIIDWADKAVVFTANLTGLTSYDTVYTFVTTAQGGQNTTPLAFTRDSSVGHVTKWNTSAMRYRKRERRI